MADGFEGLGTKGQNMNKYEEDHPLYGRDAEWISKAAEHVSGFNTSPDRESNYVHLFPDVFAALVHEYKRLKVEPAEPNREYQSRYQEMMRFRNEWQQRSIKAENKIDELNRARAINRKGIEHRDIRIAELKSTHPPEDWLTRAIELSGAPEGSDWAGLLERIRDLKDKEVRYAVMRPYTLEAHEIAGKHASGGLVGSVRKLRERAESAEAKVESSSKDWEEAQEYLCEWRDELAPFVTDTDNIDDLTPSMLSHVFSKEVKGRKAEESKVTELKAELETANSYRTGIGNDLRQVEEQSRGFANELNAVASLLDEGPARGVLFGPALEDGVAHIVNKRLVRDADRIKKLEAQISRLMETPQRIEDRAIATALQALGDYMDHEAAHGMAGSIRELIEAEMGLDETQYETPVEGRARRDAAKVSDLGKRAKRDATKIAELEAQIAGLEHARHERANAKAAEWANTGDVLIADVPTIPPPLERIAADVSRIVAALEMKENCA